MNRAASITAIAAAARSAALVFSFSLAGLAQTAPNFNPAELVRKTVQNEIAASDDSAARFMFRGTKSTWKGSTTKIYVETREGTAGMIAAYNGKPLTQQQRQDEEARVDRFLKNPDELRKKRAQEREDADRTMRIVRALPDAFVYEYAGQETGTNGIGHAGDPLVRLKFHPNPRYKPPSRVEEVLTGMQGDLLLDEAHYRIASIDGTLFKEVGFGWGILGHLDQGGHFVVHQQDVGDNVWEISSMRLKFTGKILLVKSLFIESTEVFDAFRRVPPDLTFAQAVQMVKKEDAGSAESPMATSDGRR